MFHANLVESIMSYIYMIYMDVILLNGMGSPEVLFMVRRSQIQVVGWKHGRKNSTTNMHKNKHKICQR